MGQKNSVKDCKSIRKYRRKLLSIVDQKAPELIPFFKDFLDDPETVDFIKKMVTVNGRDDFLEEVMCRRLGQAMETGGAVVEGLTGNIAGVISKAGETANNLLKNEGEIRSVKKTAYNNALDKMVDHLITKAQKADPNLNAEYLSPSFAFKNNENIEFENSWEQHVKDKLVDHAPNSIHKETLAQDGGFNDKARIPNGVGHRAISPAPWINPNGTRRVHSSTIRPSQSSITPPHIIGTAGKRPTVIYAS